MSFVYQWNIHKSSIHVGRSTNPGYDEHFHSYVEFIYLMKGNYSVKIDNTLYSFSKGDLVVIFPYQIHEFVPSTGDNYELVCTASPDIFSEYSDVINNYICVKPIVKNEDMSEECRYLLEWIAKTHSTMDDVFRLRKMLLLLIFREVIKVCELTPRSALNMTSVQRILKYCDENYLSDTLSLDTISKALGINKQSAASVCSRTGSPPMRRI